LKNKSRWREFNDRSKYRLVDLGRPAVFYIPENKLNIIIGGETVEEYLQNFLSREFGAFTSSVVANFGLWINKQRVVYRDRHRVYEVSFEGKNRIPALLERIAEVARIVDEECIYFKAGQYSCLVYPAGAQRQY